MTQSYDYYVAFRAFSEMFFGQNISYINGCFHDFWWLNIFFPNDRDGEGDGISKRKKHAYKG